MIFPCVRVLVNGLELDIVSVEGFFSKYGNCDGNNLVGLVAEAHLVRQLWKAGYDVKFVLSHNIEIREIRKNNIVYECVRDYGEVVKNMPAELRKIVEEFCEKGVRIVVDDDGNVPVFLEGKQLFKTSIKKILDHIIVKSERTFFPSLAIFDPGFEPLLLALGYEIHVLLFFASDIDILDGGLHLRKLETTQDGTKGSKYFKIKNSDEILDRIEEIFEKNAIYLKRDWWAGLEISNSKTLGESLKLLNPMVKI